MAAQIRWVIQSNIALTYDEHRVLLIYSVNFSRLLADPGLAAYLKIYFCGRAKDGVNEKKGQSFEEVPAHCNW